MTRVIDLTRTRNGRRVSSGLSYENGKLTPYSYSYSDPIETTYEFRSGGNTPFYHKPNRPPLRPTAFKYRKYRYLGESGYQYSETKSIPPSNPSYGRGAVIGDFGGNAVPGHLVASQSDIDALSTLASNAVLSKVKNQSVNMAQAYAEGHQTIRLVAQTAIRLASSMNNLKKGNLVQAARDLGVGVPKRANARFKKSYPKRQADAVSQAWLELQYGWKPLLSDVYGLSQQIAEQLNRPTGKTVTSKKKKLIPIAYRTKTTTPASLVTETSRTGSLIVTVTYSVNYTVSNPAVASAKETGLTNPLLIAWELLPFSFVADWFYPVGNFLGTLDATLGCDFNYGFKTVHWIATSGAIRSTNGVDNYGQTINMLKTDSMFDLSVERTVLNGFPSPARPAFKNPASVVHCLNALALLNQIFRK